jgi:predicted nucleotidyltransferase
MIDNSTSPELDNYIQAIKSKLRNECRLLGIFLRGSRARGDALSGSDFDFVAFVDVIPVFDHHLGFKVIKYSGSQDEKRILENPIRPLDFRDSKILFDPYGLLETLKGKCIHDLGDREKIRQRSRKLILSAHNYLKKMKASDCERSLPSVTGLVLDAARAVMVKYSITPSGRRLLYQLSLIDAPNIEYIKELITTVLGVNGITSTEAKSFFRSIVETVRSDRNINYYSEHGRFFTPERLCYWNEGFTYLIQFNITAACWVTFSLLQHYFEYYDSGIIKDQIAMDENRVFFTSLNIYTLYNIRIAAAIRLLEYVDDLVEYDK